jgi:hypothetical protein
MMTIVAGAPDLTPTRIPAPAGLGVTFGAG